jgi:group I intron endonuclease
MTSYVYLVTCLPSGKQYVGITNNIRRRWNDHVSGALRDASHNWALANAIRKYGRASFAIQEIDRFENWEEACAAEQFHIACYRTRSPQGMNLTFGGEGTPGLSIPKSPETRAKIAAGNRGRIQSDEAKALVSAANKGRKWTPEQRAALSLIRTGKTRPPETHQRMSEAAYKRWDRDRKRIGVSEPRLSGEKGIYWDRVGWIWRVEVIVGKKRFRSKFVDLQRAINWRDRTRREVGWISISDPTLTAARVAKAIATRKARKESQNTLPPQESAS